MFKYSVFFTMTLIAVLGNAAETDPVAVLQSDAPLEAKAEACRLLSISGDIAALPVLEPLLADADLSHMARYALEPMPGGEVDAALLRALNATSGRLKAGVVASLGVRRHAAAVPALIPLLADEDTFVVEAAARSLGRIAAPEGVAALTTLIAQPGIAYATAQALADGLSAAAENAVATGRAEEAARLCDAIYAVETLPLHIRTAAFRGAVLTRPPQDGLPLLLQEIEQDNPVLSAAALRIASEMDGKEAVAAAVMELLPDLSPDYKILTLQLLGELGQIDAGPALLKEAEAGDTPVRIAALAAATRLAYTPVLPLLTTLVSSEDAELAKAARNGLSYFPAEEGDAAIKNMLTSDDAQTRRIAVELISEGALPTPVELLMQLADSDTDESVRITALKGVKDYAGVPQMAGLLAHLLKPRSNDEMVVAEDVLKVLCMRQREAATAIPAEIINALCDALASSQGETRFALMRILTATGDQKAFDAILPLTSDSDGDLKDAALRAVCDWPAPLALPTLIDWVKTPPSDKIKPLALRSAVRLLMLGQDTPEARLSHYATLLELAGTPNEKKIILSGLANVGHAAALAMVLEQLGDESVKAEAVQAAIAIAEKLDTSPQNAEVLEKARALIPELNK